MKLTAKIEKHKESLIALSLSFVKGIGSKRAKRILTEADLYQEWCYCFNSGFKELPQWSNKQLAKSDFENAVDLANNQLTDAVDNSVIPLSINHPFYPKLLKQCIDAPSLLYARGNVERLNYESVSIVGTRTPSEYGRKNAKQIAGELAAEGLNVVSGFAYGVDINAHLASIDNGGFTVAVFGSGLGCIYPAVHKKYVSKILENGCLLSEQPYYAKPDRQNFPSRNRIVAGMSKATLVIESKIKGGSLITAKLAFDYNRDVYALPGLVQDEKYDGNHQLIKLNIAQLCTSSNDILQQTFEKQKTEHEPKQNLNREYPKEYQKIVHAIRSGANNIHALSDVSEENIASLQMRLVQMELDGYLKMLPGNKLRLL